MTWNNITVPRIKFKTCAACDTFFDSILLFKIREGPSHSRRKIFGSRWKTDFDAEESGKWFERNRVDASGVFWHIHHARSRAILRPLVPHFPADVAFFPGRCASERRDMLDSWISIGTYDDIHGRDSPDESLRFSFSFRDAALESYWGGIYIHIQDVTYLRRWNKIDDDAIVWYNWFTGKTQNKGNFRSLCNAIEAIVMFWVVMLL